MVMVIWQVISLNSENESTFFSFQVAPGEIQGLSPIFTELENYLSLQISLCDPISKALV
jgi:hypothetical protein